MENQVPEFSKKNHAPFRLSDATGEVENSSFDSDIIAQLPLPFCVFFFHARWRWDGGSIVIHSFWNGRGRRLVFGKRFNQGSKEAQACCSSFVGNSFHVRCVRDWLTEIESCLSMHERVRGGLWWLECQLGIAVRDIEKKLCHEAELHFGLLVVMLCTCVGHVTRPMLLEPCIMCLIRDIIVCLHHMLNYYVLRFAPHECGCMWTHTCVCGGLFCFWERWPEISGRVRLSVDLCIYYMSVTVPLKVWADLLWVDISFAIQKWIFILFKSMCGGVCIYLCVSRDDCMAWFRCSWMNSWMSAPCGCIIVFANWEMSFADVICCGPWHANIISFT
jgi:hypothetical protein